MPLLRTCCQRFVFHWGGCYWFCVPVHVLSLFCCHQTQPLRSCCPLRRSPAALGGVPEALRDFVGKTLPRQQLQETPSIRVESIQFHLTLSPRSSSSTHSCLLSYSSVNDSIVCVSLLVSVPCIIYLSFGGTTGQLAQLIYSFGLLFQLMGGVTFWDRVNQSSNGFFLLFSYCFGVTRSPFPVFG